MGKLSARWWASVTGPRWWS